jgi:hypothetical protein
MAFLSAWLRKAAGSSSAGDGQREEKDWLYSLAKDRFVRPPEGRRLHIPWKIQPLANWKGYTKDEII